MIPEDLPRGTEGVLLVQELDGLRRLCRKVLERQGYRVADAGTAEEALEAAAAFPGGPELAILDVVLPRQSGFELAGTLERSYRGLRTLYTSSHPWSEEFTGRRFLEKPFSMVDLLQKVRAVLSESATRRRTR